MRALVGEAGRGRLRSRTEGRGWCSLEGWSYKLSCGPGVTGRAFWAEGLEAKKGWICGRGLKSRKLQPWLIVEARLASLHVDLWWPKWCVEWTCS